MKKYACSNCGVISDNVVVGVREDKPKEMPNIPLTGYWAMAAFELAHKSYQLDHWNRTIVCPICDNAHHYYQGAG